MNINNNLLSLLAAGLLGGTVSLGGAYLINSSTKPSRELSEELATARQVNDMTYNVAPIGTALDFSDAAEKAIPAVVHIKTSESEEKVEKEQRANPFSNSPFGSFFDDDMFSMFGQRGPKAGTGSGVIISNDGYIITNNHVVDFGDEFEVTLSDNRKFKAKIVGTDPNTDLAVLKINADKLSPILIGDSDKAKIGQWVLAIGNPGVGGQIQLNSTVTAGIISAKGRNININQNVRKVESFIQTDAVVNPGNSGGALVDASGRLVGINAAIVTQTGAYEGYSFAIPINLASRIVDDIIKYGKSQKPALGVSITDVNADLAKDEKLSVSQGVYISEVVDGGSAQLAGVIAGDVITQVNGQETKTTAELQEKIASAKVGDSITLTINRDGSTKKIPVTLKEYKAVNVVKKPRVYQRQ
jgi:serine protease Do